MDDKERYLILKSKLRNICNKINDLDIKQDNLKTILKRSIIIDDKNPVSDKLSSIKSKIIDSKNKILYNVLPKINEKIEE